jgi:DNA-binding MarR family transcriptional regulator
MAANPTSDHLVNTFRGTVLGLVRLNGSDLSARQLGVFLTCYLHAGDHTVGSLAAELNISKPAVCRVLDRLEERTLARRQIDPRDRRSVLTRRTSEGAAFLRRLRGIVVKAAASSGAAS